MTNIFKFFQQSNKKSIGHANLVFSDREKKAIQIAARIANLDEGDFLNSPGIQILDLGCGSGILAHVLVNRLPLARVFSADLVDQRLEKVKYASTFLQSNQNGKLDFPDKQFEVIICHMVLEHVDPKNQLDILQECLRLLKINGFALIAFPNKWAPLESHYLLPFLSWIPRKLAGSYLNIFNPEISAYDCFPISKRKFFSMTNSLKRKGNRFEVKEVTYLPVLQEMNFKNLEVVFGETLNLIPFMPSRSMMIKRIE